ncbi:M56 family metallopeptidase [Sediminibacterium soli]|uniref:M56 family metallopeptidase n=1 Tax=Sediminibacterium soli TaxID=2698829 RepID=UPI00137A8F32|nr:M56 family metallopeptidase [Sediminibacterium soli]NCI46337.1 M56 family metallopeptidase [Sediminibacterium soli]
MQAWLQSPFLQSLGFAIANSLWQAGLLWLLYTLLSHLWKLSAAGRYRMAVAVQLLSFVWFAVTVQFYYYQYTESLRQNIVPGLSGIQAVLAGDKSFSTQLIRYLVRAEQALPYISVAYLLLILVLALRWVNSFRYTQSVRTQGLHRIPADWRLFVKKVAPQLGIKKEIVLFLSDRIGTPLTIGFWKPLILVPLASLNHLTTAQMEAVLLHELAHIKRYDYLVNLLLSVVEIALFFNPFTQLLSRNIRKERENCCDDWVLQFRYNATDYAQALLQIASLQAAPAFAMAAGGKRNELLVRVKRMIGQPEAAFSYRKQLFSLLLVTGMLGCMAWFNPSPVPGSPQKDTRTIAIEPMAVRVNNPLFNPVFFLSEPLKTEMQKSLSAAKEESTAQAYFTESIPPLVAAALDKAAIALEQQKAALPAQIANMEMARSHMEKLLADSLSIPAPFRRELKNAFNHSIQDISRNLQTAQTEIKTAFDQQRFRFPFDDQKVKNEIRLAMNEVAKLDLGGLVNTSLGLSGMFAPPEPDKPRKHADRKKNVAPPSLQQPVPDDREAPSEDASEEIKTISLLPVAGAADDAAIFIRTVQPVFSKTYLDQLKALALLAGDLALEEHDPETDKRIRLKLEALQQKISAEKIQFKKILEQQHPEIRQ